MKASETFLKIPIRLYNLDPSDPDFDIADYVIGYEKRDIYSIKGWGDGFSDVRSLDSVRENGYDSTRIDFLDGEMIICSLSREKFEQRYDEQMENLEKYLTED